MKQTRRADFDIKYGITPEYLEYIRSWKPPMPVSNPITIKDMNFSKLELQIAKLYQIPLKALNYLLPRYDLKKWIEYHAK